MLSRDPSIGRVYSLSGTAAAYSGQTASSAVKAGLKIHAAQTKPTARPPTIRRTFNGVAPTRIPPRPTPPNGLALQLPGRPRLGKGA